MKRRENTQTKLHKDDSGVAMIVALIVSVVVMVFCLSLLLVAYTLFSQTNRNNIQLQCKFLAQSYAEDLKEEMEDTDSDMVKYLQYKMTDTASAYGVWISTDASAEEREEYTLKGVKTYEELNLEVDAEGYHIYLTVTHKPLAGTDEDDDTDNPDDEYEGTAGQDPGGSSSAGQNTEDNRENGSAGQDPGGNGSAGAGSGKAAHSTGKEQITVKMQCVRGEDKDRGDSYTIEEEYVIPSPTGK